jgi:hypothetical protein
MRLSILAVLCAAVCLSCASTRPPQPEPVRILDAGLCWYETDRCKSIQYGKTIVESCSIEWSARCREAELEGLTRRGCSLTRMKDFPAKIMVACGGPR